MKIRYKHTNIIARDWRTLSSFYQDVFDCVPVPPERDLSGSWVDKGTGVENARISGVHLHLPGYASNGPTLEILQYNRNEPRAESLANREGITHIAFEVDDVEQVTEAVLKHGGSKIGEIASSKVEGVGRLTFIYLADPEGNIIEVQSWE
jgi:predicted enzyme related to lactoylglutathione lyase